MSFLIGVLLVLRSRAGCGCSVFCLASMHPSLHLGLFSFLLCSNKGYNVFYCRFISALVKRVLARSLQVHGLGRYFYTCYMWTLTRKSEIRVTPVALVALFGSS